MYVASGKVCEQLKTQSEGLGPTNYRYAKEDDGTYSQTDADDAMVPIITLNLDAAKCVLAGDVEPITGNAKDDDGNPIKIVFKQTETVTIDGDKVTLKNEGHIDSDPPGAKGLPCTIGFSQTGTRK